MVRAASLVFLMVSASTALAQTLASPEQSGESACAGKSRLARAPASSPAAYADPRFDVTHYLLDLRLETSPPLIVGRVTMTATCVAETLSTCLLDLSAVMRVDSVLCNGIRTSAVPYPAGFQASLDRVYHAGERFSVTLFYQGVPDPSGFGSFIFSTYDSSPWVWSLSEPYGARDWWPCKDHQGDKADSVEVRVTCATGLKVGSNGRLASVTVNGDGTSTHRWIERYPIATYLVSIAVSDFASFSDWYRYSSTDSMEILNYVLPVSLETARTALRKTVDMLYIFEQLFGRYPFITEKYGHSEFGIGGAMEHQTMTSTTTFNETTIAHELAHQWFGDLITCASWRDLWLNEGFASYGEALYREQRYGKADYRAAMDAFLTSALNSPGTLYLEDTSSVSSMFRFSRVYAKGASVLHMLRWVLGDSLFFRALGTYAADPRYRFGVASTADFQHVCEVVAGRSLETFFREWVFGERFPRYTISWSAVDDAEGTLNDVRLDQTTGTDNPEFFEMPVALRFRNNDWDTTIVVQHQASGQVFHIHTRNRPSALELDPDNWILKQVLDPGTGLPQAYGLDQNYPNPFNPGTTITLHVPHRDQATLRVYDILGREVTTLLNESLDPGIRTVTWNGTDARGTRVASGVYIYRLEASGMSLTRSMMLLR